MARGRHRGAALLHRGVQQHRHLQAGLRLHLRVPSPTRGRLGFARERTPGAVPELRRPRQPARQAAHPADRQRAARLRRRTRPRVPGRRERRDRALPPRDRRPHRRPPPGREPVRPGPVARSDEHRWRGGPARRLHPLRGVGVDAHRGLGRAHRHPHPRRALVRHPAPVRAGGWAAPCAASPTT